MILFSLEKLLYNLLENLLCIFFIKIYNKKPCKNISNKLNTNSINGQSLSLSLLIKFLKFSI